MALPAGVDVVNVWDGLAGGGGAAGDQTGTQTLLPAGWWPAASQLLPATSVLQTQPGPQSPMSAVHSLQSAVD